MRSQGSSFLRTVFSLLAIGALCLCLAGIAGFFTLPEAAAGLGPASSRLNPVQRTMLAAYLVLLEPALDQPAGDPGVEIELEVAAGENAAIVVNRLVLAGAVRDAFLLRSYLRYRGLDVGIDAGRYQISGGMTPREIADLLQTARPSEYTMTVIEGWRREQIAVLIAESNFAFGAGDFLEATAVRPGSFSFSSQIPDPPSLEGFLFPDTYLVEPDASAVEVVLMMLDNFEARVGPELRAGFERQGLTLYEAVTLASIVEREAVVPDERPLIASVFLNRLAAGIKLDADPTVQYALAQQPSGDWWKAPLSLTDLQFDSAYNTYRYSGLPPGPIANPGLAALQAVAEPEVSSFLYFRAACDGSGRHTFAFTLEEHIANACP